MTLINIENSLKQSVTFDINIQNSFECSLYIKKNILFSLNLRKFNESYLRSLGELDPYTLGTLDSWTIEDMEWDI